MRTAPLKLLAPVICLLAAALMGTNAWAQPLRLAKAVACLGIQDREPVGTGQVFPATTPRVYCYTLVEGATEAQEILHVWYHGEQKVHDYALTVKGPRWRTWSYKTIYPGQRGPWRVDIVQGNSGVLLGSVSFTIQ